MLNDWIDVTIPVQRGMVHWPGDAAFAADRQLDMGRGDVCNLSRLTLSAHTGTHMDAPLHFVKDGAAMETLPLDATVGPARVVEISDPESIKPADLEPLDLQRGERVLFKTANSARAWWTGDFDKDFVHIRGDAAELLARRGVRTVGVDYLSVGGYERDGVQTHQALLGAGVWIIEGLDLSRVAPGMVDLVCLPLKLVGVEGAPARAILRPR